MILSLCRLSESINDCLLANKTIYRPLKKSKLLVKPSSFNGMNVQTIVFS